MSLLSGKNSTILIQKKTSQVTSNSRRGMRSVVAGGLTGAINISIVFPTEFVKTQLQLDSGKNVMSANHSIMTPFRATVLESKKVKVYSGSVDVFTKTVKQHGARGMYKGVSVLLIGAVPTYSVRFGVFDTLKSRFSKVDGNLSPLARLGCGLGAGVAEATLTVTLMETLKVRMIADQKRKVPQFRGVVHAATSIVRKEGFFGIYKGWTPTVLKQGSNQAIRFLVMESLRSWYSNTNNDNRPVPFPLVALFGALAGGASVLGNTPVDVVKTRMQNGSSKSALDVVYQIARKEGLRGFYKGCLPRMNRVCLEVGLAFCIYDTVMDIFKTVWPTK